MTKFGLFIVFIYALFCFSNSSSAAEYKIPELPRVKQETKNFIIYHHNTRKGRFLAIRAEEIRKKVIKDSGVKKFGSWKNKCIIALYKTREEYLVKSGMQKWSGACAVSYHTEQGMFRMLLLCEDTPNLFNHYLPHELTHVILAQIMGTKGNLPLWLNEGLAQYEEGWEKAANIKISAAMKIKNGNYISIKELIEMKNVPNDKVILFYGESASFVEYLLDVQPKYRFTKMFSSLKNGKSSFDAISVAYKTAFSSFSAMEREWNKHMLRRYYEIQKIK